MGTLCILAAKIVTGEGGHCRGCYHGSEDSLPVVGGVTECVWLITSYPRERAGDRFMEELDPVQKL